MEWTGMYLCLSLMPVLNLNSWQHKSSKCATESTATSVSGDCITIRGWMVAACLGEESSSARRELPFSLPLRTPITQAKLCQSFWESVERMQFGYIIVLRE